MIAAILAAVRATQPPAKKPHHTIVKDGRGRVIRSR